MDSANEKRRAKLWYATTQLDEYFRLLGGSGCYLGYCDWHVPALLTLALDHDINDQSLTDSYHFEQSIKKLISHLMWEQTDGLPQRAIELVNKIKPVPDDVDWFTARVTDRYPMAYSSHEKEGWADFLDQRQWRNLEPS